MATSIHLLRRLLSIEPVKLPEWPMLANLDATLVMIANGVITAEVVATAIETHHEVRVPASTLRRWAADRV